MCDFFFSGPRVLPGSNSKQRFKPPPPEFYLPKEVPSKPRGITHVTLQGKKANQLMVFSPDVSLDFFSRRILFYIFSKITLCATCFHRVFSFFVPAWDAQDCVALLT